MYNDPPIFEAKSKAVPAECRKKLETLSTDELMARLQILYPSDGRYFKKVKDGKMWWRRRCKDHPTEYEWVKVYDIDRERAISLLMEFLAPEYDERIVKEILLGVNDQSLTTLDKFSIGMGIFVAFAIVLVLLIVMCNKTPL